VSERTPYFSQHYILIGRSLCQVAFSAWWRRAKGRDAAGSRSRDLVPWMARRI